MLPHLIDSSLHYLSTGRLREVKNKGEFQTFSYESSRGHFREVVAYKRSDMTCKLLVFWKTGRCGEVVAYEWWSQPEVRLYCRLIQSKRE